MRDYTEAPFFPRYDLLQARRSSRGGHDTPTCLKNMKALFLFRVASFILPLSHTNCGLFVVVLLFDRRGHAKLAAFLEWNLAVAGSDADPPPWAVSGGRDASRTRVCFLGKGASSSRGTCGLQVVAAWKRKSLPRCESPERCP